MTQPDSGCLTTASSVKWSGGNVVLLRAIVNLSDLANLPGKRRLPKDSLRHRTKAGEHARTGKMGARGMLHFIGG
jgi:hypothetical protein